MKYAIIGFGKIGTTLALVELETEARQAAHPGRLDKGGASLHFVQNLVKVGRL
jgi:predicted dinucleotide-binding enzyme